MIKIGNLKLENPFLLAPLAGITDGPTRSLAKEQGAALVYSEMISGKGLLYKDKNTERLLKIFPGEEPIAYQVFGADPEVLAHTANALKDRENAILDINMGCPVPKIVRNGEGSALLKKVDLIFDLVQATVKSAGKPVTAKIRIGWDVESVNAVEVAKAIESAGAAAVAVHGRTREQYYNGKADWEQIRKVREAIAIPVIGNGDIFSGKDANRMLLETGCDMVMIARGALGNPWIFREATALWRGEQEYVAPSREEKVDAMILHIDRLLVEKGEYVTVREMRKHVGWYIKGIPGAARIRREVNSITSVDELKKVISLLKE